MRFEKRVRRLESESKLDPVILHFADGSTRTIPFSDKHLRDLYRATTDPSAAMPLLKKHLDWIAECTGMTEPSGHLY